MLQTSTTAITIPTGPDSLSRIEPANARAGSPHFCGPCDDWFGTGELGLWSAPVIAPVPCRVRRQAILVHEGAPAHHIYIVQAGDFKVVRTAEDGYEQVLDFPGAGDVLGLDGLAQGHSLSTIQALQDATVYAIPVADVASLRASNAVFDARMQAALAGQWIRAHDIAWLMAAVGADRRTARFLVHLSRRMAARGMSSRKLRLRMSRRDIAAHLGLAHESISRALTALTAAGLLNVCRSDVEIVDLPALQRLANNTRGRVDDEPHFDSGVLLGIGTPQGLGRGALAHH